MTTTLMWGFVLLPVKLVVTVQVNKYLILEGECVLLQKIALVCMFMQQYICIFKAILIEFSISPPNTCRTIIE